jgi:hypothetical protein
VAAKGQVVAVALLAVARLALGKITSLVKFEFQDQSFSICKEIL